MSNPSKDKVEKYYSEEQVKAMLGKRQYLFPIPAIVLPSNESAEEILLTKPVLFDGGEYYEKKDVLQAMNEFSLSKQLDEGEKGKEFEKIFEWVHMNNWTLVITEEGDEQCCYNVVTDEYETMSRLFELFKTEQSK